MLWEGEIWEESWVGTSQWRRGYEYEGCLHKKVATMMASKVLKGRGARKKRRIVKNWLITLI